MNEKEITCETMILAGANAVGDDGCGGWIKLVDYGDYQHRLGMQIVDASACKQMARRFSSLRQRLARRFRGVPIYIGHPDDPAFRGQVGHDDTRAYGWVKFIEARDNGLWIYPKWSRAGGELLENAYYKFLSPRWEMVPLGNGSFTPRQLLSIGLTNTPNMNVEAIANQEDMLEEMAEIMPDEKIVSDISPDDNPRERTSLPSGVNMPDVALLRMPEQGGPIVGNCARMPESVMRRQSITQSLDRRCCLPTEMKKHRVLTLVRERMEKECESFATAWCNVKRTNPFWFEG
ncbi:MAG: hypothetical protein LBI34_00080 [Puniceicoccales bacterium]|jgi:hypothetical protein|nr:hypothetical protein [Puniceicoccales bacterium]